MLRNFDIPTSELPPAAFVFPGRRTEIYALGRQFLHSPGQLLAVETHTRRYRLPMKPSKAGIRVPFPPPRRSGKLRMSASPVLEEMPHFGDR